MEYVLEMKDISKSFPGVKALDHVQLQVKPGEVHALMGENGAGKSTLMKILMAFTPRTRAARSSSTVSRITFLTRRKPWTMVLP